MYMCSSLQFSGKARQAAASWALSNCTRVKCRPRWYKHLEVNISPSFRWYWIPMLSFLFVASSKALQMSRMVMDNYLALIVTSSLFWSTVEYQTCCQMQPSIAWQLFPDMLHSSSCRLPYDRNCELHIELVIPEIRKNLRCCASLLRHKRTVGSQCV